MLFPCTVCNKEFDIDDLNRFYICDECERYIDDLNQQEYEDEQRRNVYINTSGVDPDVN